MTKEQNQNQYKNFTSGGNMFPHIKIICCLDNLFEMFSLLVILSVIQTKNEEPAA
jgi:hypothetical protein